MTSALTVAIPASFVLGHCGARERHERARPARWP